MTFGKWIEIARKDNGWSLQVVAGICGYSASHIRQIELEKYNPSLFSATCIAQALGFKLWEVLKIIEETK